MDKTILIVIIAFLFILSSIVVIVGYYITQQTTPPATTPTPPATTPATPTLASCTGDNNWGKQTAASGGQISQKCPDGSSATATCNNGNWENVGKCPVATSFVSKPAPTKGVDPVSTFSQIIHSKEGNCLDGDGNSKVYIGGCNGGGYQNWKYSNNTITQQPSGKCLDGDGSSLYLSTCNGTPYQSWTKTGGLLKHGQSGKCVDSNGSSLYFGNCDTTNPYQQWQF